MTCKFFQYIKPICVHRKICKVCKYINKFFIFLHQFNGSNFSFFEKCWSIVICRKRICLPASASIMLTFLASSVISLYSHCGCNQLHTASDCFLTPPHCTKSMMAISVSPPRTTVLLGPITSACFV